MTTALDIVKGALRRIGAYQSGEAIAQADATDDGRAETAFWESVTADAWDDLG